MKLFQKKQRMLSDKKLIFAHSPDSDDAFILRLPKVNLVFCYSIDHYMADIETLNSFLKRILSGWPFCLKISVSIDKYRIMLWFFMGRNYGLKGSTKTNSVINEYEGSKIAVEGKDTTSWALFRIFCKINARHYLLILMMLKNSVVKRNLEFYFMRPLYEKRGFNW